MLKPSLIRRAASLLVVLLFAVLHVRPAGAAERVKGWPVGGYSRVVAYSFEVPGGEPQTLFVKGKVDQSRLEKLKKREAVLSPEQVKRLLRGTFESKVKYAVARCYEPHHIFVFYNAKSQPVGAIEVCFTCNGVHTAPHKDTGGRYDFPALAKLTSELGLGVAPGASLDGYLGRLKLQLEP